MSGAARAGSIDSAISLRRQKGSLFFRSAKLSAWHFASFAATHHFGRFSNRPFRVKRFQTIHHCSVDVAHGLVLLFGIGTKALVWGFFSQEV
jgi:hypothetical protein